jgi:glucose-6-phosphate isomerase
MIKVLNVHTQGKNVLANQKLSDAQKSEIKARAEQAVKTVLETKPGGLLGLEAQLAEYASTTSESLKSFKARHREFVIVGIGGSSLGIQVLTESFNRKNFHFIDNVDAYHVEEMLQKFSNIHEVGWVFISKSGRTVETLAALELIQQFATERSVSLPQHSLVVTEKKESDLYNWSQKNGVLFFEIPLSVGGRFSVLSAVGLVPAVLMDLNLQKIQEGALKAYADKETLLALTQASLESFARDEWVTVLWSYSSRLKSFGFWWQQLWAESLAKKINRKGQPALRASTPLPLVGATDQHSVLQQVMEGARDKMVMFLRVEEAEKGQMVLNNTSLSETQTLKGKTLGSLLKAEAEAIQKALTEVGVPNISVQIPGLREENVAHLFMFFQLLVMTLGEALDINTFDQPGVELGKVMAKQILAEGSK